MQYNTLESKVAIRMAVGKNSLKATEVSHIFMEGQQFLWI